MPKTAINKRNDFIRGRLVGLSSLILALIFMIAVANNVRGLTGHGVEVASSANFVPPLFALIAAGISYSWDRRLRLTVALAVGILLASFVIWLMANGYSI